MLANIEMEIAMVCDGASGVSYQRGSDQCGVSVM